MSSQPSLPVPEPDAATELSELGKAVGIKAAEVARSITVDELANSVSHGVGLGLAMAGLVVLLVLSVTHGDARMVTSSAIYGGSLVLLYLASTLYHSFHPPRLKQAFRIFDHAAIYFLIAGTYTPFTLITLKDDGGIWIFAFVWAVAIFGALKKIFFFGRFPKASLLLYLGLGWVIVLAIKPLVEHLSPQGLALVFLGGIFYTGGVLFYLWERLFLNHTIWHLFVMAGSTSHYLAILLYVVWPTTAG